MQIDPLTPSDGSVLDSFQSSSKDVMPAEDGVMEDTFVDCPDEIETFDSQQNSEENDNLQDFQAYEPGSGIKVPEMIAEIELLRDKLEKSVLEKEQLAQDYEVDLFMPHFFPSFYASFLSCFCENIFECLFCREKEQCLCVNFPNSITS